MERRESGARDVFKLEPWDLAGNQVKERRGGQWAAKASALGGAG